MLSPTGDYGAKMRTIGTVHAKIGLEPRWYIGGYAIVLDHFINAAVEEIFPKGRVFSRKNMTPADFGKALGSLAKAVLLDMDLAISVYLEGRKRPNRLHRRRPYRANRNWFPKASARRWRNSPTRTSPAR